MKLRLKNIFSLAVIICTSHLLIAQHESTLVKGKVLDQQSGAAIEFATIMIGNKNTGEAITGTTAGSDGSFEVRTRAKEFFVEVSFIGFQKFRIENPNILNGVAQVGTITLTSDDQMLEDVVIQGEKSTTEFRLDKRVFNVGKDLSSAGGSAYDVLNNVPSVNVNIEGEVSLRGSTGVQMLINGKPSVLTSEEGNALGTITADMIERVEVITNPSAKYDAEGTTGIINIVIKKEERKGINGSLSLNTGTPHNHSVGLSVNRRTEKFNLFSQFGIGYRELPNRTKNLNTSPEEEIFSKGIEFRNEQYYNVILGTDYHINDNNVITVSGNFAYEIEDQPSDTDFEQTDSGVTRRWNRTENTEATNPKLQYEVNYKRDFKDDEDHDLVLSALGNFFGKDLESVFTNTAIENADNQAGQQLTETAFAEGRYTFKADYTKPINEILIIETGGQYVLNNVNNDFLVQDEVNGTFVPNPDFNNTFEYDQNVLGLYGTLGYEGSKWGYKLGLRMENTDLDTRLVQGDSVNNQNFTNLFPTFHTSYKVNKNYSMQIGYSRRISRPRLWDLNPFFNIRNTNRVRRGNPNLLPEFTDSYEFANIYDLGKASLNFTVYHRQTTDVRERITTFEQQINPTGDTLNIAFTTPFNLGTENSTGLEFNTKVNATQWLTLQADFNYFYFVREGSYQDGESNNQNFDFSADRWTSKVTSQLKLPFDIDVELTGRFRSSFQTIQGERTGNQFMDIGIRKKIMKGKGVINASARDVFASRFFEEESLLGENFAYSRRQRGRFLTLGFSYGFGKGEAMEYGGQRRRW